SIHQDYPYPIVHTRRESILSHCKNVSIPEDLLEMQMILSLDPFTLENGATAMLAGSQQWDLKHPPPSSESFWKESDRMECEPGSVILSHGCCWHSSGVNHSDKPRVALLAQYLRKGIPRMVPALDTMDQRDVWDRIRQKTALSHLLAPVDPPMDETPEKTNTWC